MKTKNEIRAELGSLVGEVEKFLDGGAELGDELLDSKLYEIVELWIENMDCVKLAFWWSEETKNNIIDCQPAGDMAKE